MMYVVSATAMTDNASHALRVAEALQRTGVGLMLEGIHVRVDLTPFEPDEDEGEVLGETSTDEGTGSAAD